MYSQCAVITGHLNGLQNLSVIPERNNTYMANVFIHVLLGSVGKLA